MPYRGVYDPENQDSYKVSRSGIEYFIQCPHCFYLEKRLGLKRPSGPPFSLNSAVDHLLKKEFDALRVRQEAHPLMKEYGINAIPFSHESLDTWRSNFKGVQFLHEKTNLYVYGAVDDVWLGNNGKLIVVDYKSTAKDTEVTLDAEWQMGYKRQMEVYQWLLRRNRYEVSDTGYFVYCNGKKDAQAFDGKLEFSIKLIPYIGDSSWVEEVLYRIKDCLNSDTLPKYTANCEWCTYQQKSQKLLTEPT